MRKKLAPLNPVAPTSRRVASASAMPAIDPRRFFSSLPLLSLSLSRYLLHF